MKVKHPNQNSNPPGILKQLQNSLNMYLVSQKQDQTQNQIP